MARSYKDLLVWRKAKQLAIDVYRATEAFPKAEVFGITAQIRRAAVSIPSNIAEGQGRLSRGEFSQFLGNARGSLLELETQLEIAGELSFLSQEVCSRLQQQSYEVLGLLNHLLASLRRKGVGA